MDSVLVWLVVFISSCWTHRKWIVSYCTLRVSALHYTALHFTTLRSNLSSSTLNCRTFHYSIPSGSVASRAGPLLAACDRFEVLISGVGGHAAMPHLTVDPIVAASAIVMNLQTIVSRTISPLESGVCSITKIEAGEAFNIIPASVLMRGTIRSLATDTLMELQKKVDHIILSTSEVYGCNTTITWSPDFYPATKNDPTLFEEFSKDVGASVSEEGVTRDIEPTMGAEDFAFVAENIPSTFFLLGQGSGTSPPTNYGLHHPHFALDESVLPRGVELHVALALRALRKIQMEQA